MCSYVRLERGIGERERARRVGIGRGRRLGQQPSHFGEERVLRRIAEAREHQRRAGRGDLRQVVLDGVVAAVRKRPDEVRWNAAWSLLVLALDTGAPDLVVVPAATLAALRRDGWEVPAQVERLAGAVSLSRRADTAGARR